MPALDCGPSSQQPMREVWNHLLPHKLGDGAGSGNRRTVPTDLQGLSATCKVGQLHLDQLSQKMQEGAKRLVSCLAITIRQRSEGSRGRHQCSRGSHFPRLKG